MRNKILPVVYPKITSYVQHAHLLSILQNMDDYIPWLYNNYIQIFMQKDFKVPYPFFFRHMYYDICPFIEYQEISKLLVAKWASSFSEFVIESIDMGFYVIVYLDQFYLKNAYAYQKVNFPHSTMIFGYDQEKKVFHLADFYKNHKYAYVTETMENVEQAYYCDMNRFDFYCHRFLVGDHVCLLKPTPCKEYTLNKKMIINQLEDYENSVNSYDKMNCYESVYFSTEKCAYGLDVYNIIISFLLHMKENAKEVRIGYFKGIIGYQLFYIPYDHKKLMFDRVKHLDKIGWIHDSKSIIEYFRDVVDSFSLILKLAIKYSITNDTALIDRIIRILEVAYGKEKTAIKLLLYCLQKTENMLTDLCQ